MNKAHISAARLRLLSVSEHMEAVRLSENAEPVVQPLHDAVLQLSQVCGALLDDAEDREPPQDGDLEWLGTLPVGSFVRDNTGDIWRKTDERKWICWDPSTGRWDVDESGVWELEAWAPFTAAESPSPLPDSPVLWLDTLPVGTVVNDRDGDPWRKVRNRRWQSGQDGEYGGLHQAADDIDHWGPFTLADAVPMPEIKVGDVLVAAEQLRACPRGTVVLTYAGDAWQQHTNNVWFATGDECEADAVQLLREVHSVTVIYLPK